MNFHRFRRIRNNPLLRDMVRESYLSKNDFMYPLFVTHGENVKNPVSSMPGVFQMSVDNILRECEELVNLGIKSLILFGIPSSKDEIGSEAWAEDGIIQRAIRAIRREGFNLIVTGDVCLCEYTSHGHCGVLDGEHILNDKSIEIYARTAVSQALAGADLIAPSDMMDGRVQAIREALDANGFAQTPIMSYSAKYASAFYGPFRDAAEGAPKFGDRKSHQMDIANSDEALREVEQDVIEGADIVMVKPAGPYLDIIYRVKNTFGMPVAAYQVSGEYSMIKAAAMNGWVDGTKIMVESLTAIKRAGADIILTYFAKEIAEYLSNQ